MLAAGVHGWRSAVAQGAAIAVVYTRIVMMGSTLGRIGRVALDLLYPPRCVLCGAGGPFLCSTCESGLPRAVGRRCDACWLPQTGSCLRCEQRPLAVDRVRSAFRFEGQARRLVHAFKFSYQSCLSEALARPMLPLLSEADPAADLLVPVAMSGLRQRQRGYNQSHLLAKQLGLWSGLPVQQALSRRRFDGPQTAAPDAAERWRRVQGAFALRQPAAVDGRRVLLIDDVATTGATLDACARELLAAGAKAVSAVTFGRED